jgi:hypothetical protein
MSLILRKTRMQARIEGLNPSIWGEDDYSVTDGETRVGRIYQLGTRRYAQYCLRNTLPLGLEWYPPAG